MSAAALSSPNKVKEPVVKPPGMVEQLIKDKVLVWNLCLMLINWVAASFIFYLLNFFIKYMPGDIYINSVIGGLSCFASPLQGGVLKLFGNKNGQAVSFSIGAFSAVLLSFFDRNTSHFVFYAVVLLIVKAGALLAYGFVYVIHVDLFPTSFLVRSYGFCSIICRALSMFAPLIAEVPNPSVPLTVVVSLNVIAVVFTLLLRKRTANVQVIVDDP